MMRRDAAVGKQSSIMDGIFASAAVNYGFQYVGSPKDKYLARQNRNLLAGFGVSPDTLAFLANGEAAERGNFYGFAPG